MPRRLIVDDHPELLEVALKALGPGGYDIRTAPDGEEGLRLAQESPPDLIVTDVNMPRMDGWTMVKRPRSDARLAFVPVIFLTSRTASEDHIRGFRLGADDYLDKSTSFWELPDRVKRALEKRRELEPAASTSAGSLTGRCAVIGLAALLTIFEAGRRSGILRLRRTSPSVEGLELRPLKKTRDREALFELLRWSDGVFDFTPGSLRTANDVEWCTSRLLIEGARRIDAAPQGP